MSNELDQDRLDKFIQKINDGKYWEEKQKAIKYSHL